MSARSMPVLKLPPRGVVLAVSAAAGVAFVALLTVLLGETRAAVILLDRGGLFPYPFTIQNALHVLFFLGVGELVVRWRTAEWESRFVNMKLLPEDERTVLQSTDLGPIRQRVARSYDADNGFLPYLIDLLIFQFQASRSVDQTVSVLNSSLELIAHRVDLRYSVLRYLSWVIPTVGFIGTVVGIAATLAMVDPADPDLRQLTASLAVAFNTTLLALMLSAVLVLGIHVVQQVEERSVNDAGRYCLKNLINRLYVSG